MTEMERMNALRRFEEGKAPEDAAAVRGLMTGIEVLADFWEKMYLREFIAPGGSKVKFVTGRRGSGVSFFLKVMEERAVKDNFVKVSFSARDVWLHDFREIYLEIFRQCSLDACLQGCADEIIRQMGFEPEKVGAGMTFLDYLSSVGQNNPLTKKGIRDELKNMFLDNPRMDNNFALCCSLITGGILGYPSLEPQSREILISFLSGDKTVKLSMLRALGLSPSRITKYNARHMLRSLCETVRLSGKNGIYVSIDDLDILVNRAGSANVRYTKMRRDDTYESIRQMIDEIDSFRNIMVVYGFDRKLMDQEGDGFKSYQALWMRIQNEIVGERFNKFNDIVNLDKLGWEIYTPAVLAEMSVKMADYGNALISGQTPFETYGAGSGQEESTDTRGPEEVSAYRAEKPYEAVSANRAEKPYEAISAEKAEELIRKAEFGALGLPLMVLQEVQGMEAGQEETR